MMNTESNGKYDKAKIKKIIEQKRGGLLVEQLYEAIPEEERPARSYFVEFLRSIKGVYISPFDVFTNRYFVTTLKDKQIGKRRLLVMLAAWEQMYKRCADWYVEPNALYKIYGELIYRLNDRSKSYYNIGGTENLVSSYLWMAWLGGKQKSALKLRHKNVEGETSSWNSSSNKLKISSNLAKEEKERVNVGNGSIWENPYQTSKGLLEDECVNFYQGNFWLSNLYEELDTLYDKELYVPLNEDKLHIVFLKDMIDLKRSYNELGKEYKPNIPSIHLYSLHRKKIYLNIIRNKNNGVGELIFNIFDVDDNLTFDKILSCTKCIFEFMTYHRISKPFVIFVHTWSENKKYLYYERFKITLNSILRKKLLFDGTKFEGRFRADLQLIFAKFFKGVVFKSLDIDRFLYEKGKHYWTKNENSSLLDK